MKKADTKLGYLVVNSTAIIYLFITKSINIFLLFELYIFSVL